MPRLLLFALVLLVAVYGVPRLVAGFEHLDRAKRRRLGRGMLGLVGAALVIAVLARFGLQWAGVIGAAVWAVLRAVAPWIFRLLPLAHRMRQQARTTGSAGPDDRARGDGTGGAARAARGMSRAEALEVLGLDDQASRDEILQSYRNLMRKVHPDAPGGSTYLATKLNQAKDVLLA